MQVGDGRTRRLPGLGRPRSLAACIVAGACLFGAVSSASASKLYVDSSGTLRFVAAKGEVNRVEATDLGTGGFTVVSDPGSLIHVGAGCVLVTAHQASCALPASNLQDMRIDLLDQDDSARAFKLSTGSIAINGGAGNDTIEDLPQSGADVNGGDGADAITVHPNFGGRMAVRGGAGDDTITALGAAGTVDGEGNNDVITLTTVINAPSGPVSAAYGGAGNDRILADGNTTIGLLAGGDGGDRITTDDFATAATMDGGAGRDRITSLNVTGGGMPFLYPAHIFGGSGPDIIDGGGDGDTLDCGTEVDRYKAYVGDSLLGCEIPF